MAVHRLDFQAFCVLKASGECNEDMDVSVDTIEVIGPIEFDKTVKINGIHVKPFPVDENFDQEFTIETPKGFKSEIRIYLTSDVDFECLVIAFSFFPCILFSRVGKE